MTADAVSSEATAAKLSPRKQRQSKPLADTFFAGRGGAGSGSGDVTSTPSAPAMLSSSQAPFSSSPAFATPLHPMRPFVPGEARSTAAAVLATSVPAASARPTILPILLPPTTLRPLAFRTFTKKHSLTLTSSALQELANFIGRHCGSGWREEGLAERVLEETAKSWKNRNCGFIVDGASAELKDILKTLEGNMSGGRIMVGGPGGGAGARAGAVDAAGRNGSAMSRVREGGNNGPQRGGIPRQNSLLLDSTRESDITNTRLGLRPTVSSVGGVGGGGKPLLTREDSQASLGMSRLDVEDDEEDADDDGLLDPRRWLKVVGAYDQPRMVYNVAKKHFERQVTIPFHKTGLFRNRFNVIHQRLLRNEMFQSSAVAEARAVSTLQLSGSSVSGATHKITPVANLLGRHGTHHMLLGMLVVLPTGNLSICDLTASITLDVSSAVAIPEDSAWFTPGMIVLVDGVYEEEEEAAGRGLNGATGVGGTIGGRFQAFLIGQPPSETRRDALGISGPDGVDGANGTDHTIGGGFGWIDFMGVGSHRAVGARMRKLEQRFLQRQLQQHRQQKLRLRRQQQQQQQQNQLQLRQQRLLTDSQDGEADEPEATQTNHDEEAGLDSDDEDLGPRPPSRQRVVLLGELNLDQPRTLQALRKVLGLYAAEPEGATPVAFVLTGNFVEHAVMAGGGSGGSIEYKEYFDALASALSDYPTLLQSSSFVFVPGDNDGWVSAFSGGAAVPLPRKPVPELFTSRVRRAFATANAEVVGASSNRVSGEAVWTTNPSRLSLFGPNHEIVLFRDDTSSRLRRTAVRLAKPAAPEVPEAPEAAPAVASQDDMDVDGTAEAQAQAQSKPVSASGIPYDVQTARKLVKTILDQGYLAPFKQSLRPVHWDFASALHLYPLPTALVLVDTTAPPFCVTYEGCHVMNPSSLLVAGRRGAARWIEYEIGRTGKLRECTF
ncbi:DNA polymerase epsilon subunit 2 [Sporothrix schenckii 1099-18]|uniref:DNA polymerase epsilon subunit B n=1 Tax=Sporothrix schenckii 1099-18 TaxID=1397361 RepID=A0A0F2M127_SPOSC|nr:DNA polymerase epsilon subunit 2 [Sporothrix schenckii 1099-18]KJR81861.1 DNA polymerase epsilon subunit 2 [Sporothrix schenckii 1099-18]